VSPGLPRSGKRERPPSSADLATPSPGGSLIATLPGRSYTDQAVFAREQATIFESGWFCALYGADIAAPGQFRVVQVGRESLIIARQHDGSLRAFLNVCRHRGARLCTEEAGQVKRNLRCTYHAWAYGLDGRLVAAPNLARMPDIDREQYGLVKVHLREWLGYAWVCLADQPPSFTETVAGAAAERLGSPEAIERYRVPDLVLGRRVSYDVAANWKLIVENFMECYHCATIHPELTSMLPEFAGGIAAQVRVGHGAGFADGAQGFTIDGSGGFGQLPGIEPGQDRRYFRGHHPAAGVHQPGPGPRDPAPDVPAGRRPDHRGLRLAVRPRGGGIGPGRVPVG
jgi:Rieske 2Fe-2S family protein